MAFQTTEISSLTSSGVSATSCAVSCESGLPNFPRNWISSSILAIAIFAALLFPARGVGARASVPTFEGRGASLTCGLLRGESSSDSGEVSASSSEAASSNSSELESTSSASAVDFLLAAPVAAAATAPPAAALRATPFDDDERLTGAGRSGDSSSPSSADLPTDPALLVLLKLGRRASAGLFADGRGEPALALLAAGVKPLPSVGTERMRELGEALLMGKRRSDALTLLLDDALRLTVSVRVSTSALEGGGAHFDAVVADEDASDAEMDDASLAAVDAVLARDPRRKSPIVARQFKQREERERESGGRRGSLTTGPPATSQPIERCPLHFRTSCLCFATRTVALFYR